MGKRLGLIIGINSYQDAAFRPLQYAETDARALAQWLVNVRGGNWSPADIQYVQGAYATRELVEALISQQCINMARPGDLVFLYFAGHAFLDEKTGEGYLALANTQYRQPGTGLHFPSLAQQAMSKSQASQVIFMLDCFQSGHAWTTKRLSFYDARPLLGPTTLNTLQRLNDRVILYSCRGNEFAPELGEKYLGIFAHRLLLGLCGSAAGPATKQITIQSLYSFLSSSLGEQQRPQLFGQAYHPIILTGEMPDLASSQSGEQLPKQQSEPFKSPFASEPPNTPLQSASTGTLTAQPQTAYSHAPAATAQISPRTTGQLSSLSTEQQSAMLLRQARHLIQLQNLAEAFNYIERALQMNPADTAALILKAQLLGTVGRFQDALVISDRLIQLDASNALVWSLRAALLANTGHYQPALEAVEQSLELDPGNPETYTLKTNIMDHMATMQSIRESQKMTTASPRAGGAASFFTGAAIHFFGFVLGAVGAGLPLAQPHLPVIWALAMQSLGLALLCVNAARGSYLYGFARFGLTLLFSIAAIAIAGGLYKFGQARLLAIAQANPPMLIPILFLGAWLVVAAAVPLMLSLGGLIAGLIIGVRRKP